jgi:hypothetical protein
MLNDAIPPPAVGAGPPGPGSPPPGGVQCGMTHDAAGETSFVTLGAIGACLAFGRRHSRSRR